MKRYFTTAIIMLSLLFASCSMENQYDLDAGRDSIDIGYARAVSPETVFTYSGKTVRVKVYSRDVSEAKNHPVFKYSDLINRAINYKNANPSANVYIRFAIYKIGENSYVGFNPSHSASYGYVKGFDHGGANSEKLIYSIVKAAYNQVYIDFVFHKDNSGDTLAYLNGFMNNPCHTDSSKKVSDYLRVRKIGWGNESFQQMHSKFMTVSHYASDSGSLIANTVYATTTNIDDHDNNGIPIGKDWVQSGILINSHSELKASFDNYFNIIYNNYNNQTNFHSAVRTAHAGNSLNYDDYHFSSYFFPIPLSPAGNYTYIPETGDGSPSNGNAWDVNFNPIAKYVEMMAATSGNRYFKTNTYHLKMDNFGKKLYDRLYQIYNAGDGGLKHYRLVVNTNSYEHVYPLSLFNNIGIIKEPKLTHAKDTTFALSSLSQYYSVTGSANLKLDAHFSKANNNIVVKEYTTEHPVYNAYKSIYEYQY